MRTQKKWFDKKRTKWIRSLKPRKQRQVDGSATSYTQAHFLSCAVKFFTWHAQVFDLRHQICAKRSLRWKKTAISENLALCCVSTFMKSRSMRNSYGDATQTVPAESTLFGYRMQFSWQNCCENRPGQLKSLKVPKKSHIIPDATGSTWRHTNERPPRHFSCPCKHRASTSRFSSANNVELPSLNHTWSSNMQDSHQNLHQGKQHRS